VHLIYTDPPFNTGGRQERTTPKAVRSREGGRVGFGGRSYSLFYVKDPRPYTFNREAVERIPYMAPGLVAPDKALRGRSPTHTWRHTIVAAYELGRRFILTDNNPSG